LDQDRLYENPLLTEKGQNRILLLCESHNLKIPSLTGDCFMQAPFWKSEGSLRDELERDFIEVVKACARLGIGMLVIPLVDNGRLEIKEHEDILIFFLKKHEVLFRQSNIKILFESDYTPSELGRFIGRLSLNLFGINYDIGNSAALGLDPNLEFNSYGIRILNVHVKDRVLGGSTVPLGKGNANFNLVFSCLKKVNYRGNYILQTARANDDNHSGLLAFYRDITLNYLENA
jgi:hexulose-6-phosphate isomerase